MNKNPFRKSVYGTNASLKKGIVAIVLAAALLISVAGIASAASQKWHLKDDSASIPTGTDYWMTRNAGHGAAFVSIGGVSKIWVSNEAAQIDASFGTGAWTAVIDFTNPPSGYIESGEALTVYIGSFNPDTHTFNSAMSKQFSIPTGGIYDNTITPGSSFTVPTGDYLALKLEMSGGSVDVDVDRVEPSASYIQSPSVDPGYPYPELPTIILMSTGLLTLFGYVMYKRRNNKSQ